MNIEDKEEIIQEIKHQINIYSYWILVCIILYNMIILLFNIYIFNIITP